LDLGKRQGNISYVALLFLNFQESHIIELENNEAPGRDPSQKLWGIKANSSEFNPKRLNNY
jgi:hypothetical protein